MKKATAIFLALLMCAAILPAASAVTPAPAITEVTSPIMFNCAANIKVTVSDAPTGAYVLFNGAVSAQVSGGSAMLRLAAGDLSAYSAGGFAPVTLCDASGNVLASSSVEIKAYDNIWSIVTAYADGTLRLQFNIPMYYKGTNSGTVTVAGVGSFASYPSETTPFELLVPNFPQLEPGTYKVTAPKVKIECFPSYSFTYSADLVVGEPDTSVKLTDAWETMQLSQLAPASLTNDGAGNIEALYDVTSLSGQMQTFPYFAIQNVADPDKLELSVGNHEWAGYTGMKLGQVDGLPGVYKKITGNSVHWERERTYPDYVIWTVYYDGAVVGTFKVTVDVPAE